MFEGPVVVTRDVIVLLMNEPKIAVGLITAERIRQARLSGAASMQRKVKMAMLSFVRGFGLGISASAIVIIESNAATAPVARIRIVGLRLISVGQRERCHAEDRWVRL